MFTAGRLLRLYPIRWRARYGEEFLELLGPEPLPPQQVIDIVSGAIDAWLSSEVRNVTGAATTTGGTMAKAISICRRSEQRYSTRDGLIGAAVMLGATALLVLTATLLIRSGWTSTGEAMLNLSFMASIVLSLPFWLMKHQPWKAQAFVVGGTLTMLIAIGIVAAILS